MLGTCSAPCLHMEVPCDTELTLSRGQDKCPGMVSDRRGIKDHLANPKS